MQKKYKKFLKRLLLCSMSAAMMLLPTGCGKSSDRLEVAVIAKKNTGDYWARIKKGAFEAGEEMDIKVTYDSPENESEIQQQVELFSDIAEKGVDAIVLAPSDTDALNEVIKEADSNGIPVITIDSDVSGTERKSCISTMNKSGGAIAGRAAKSLVGEQGQVAIISNVTTAQNTIERIEGFKEAVANSGLEIVGDIQYCEGDREKAKAQALDFIANYPDLSLIYGVNESSTLGICDAVSEKGLSGKIKVVGFDCSPTLAEFMRNGTASATVVQNPYNMGYLGVRYAKKLVEGEKIAPVLDTGATLVTPENIDEENIQLLIEPVE